MAEHTINGWPLIPAYGDPLLATGTVPGTTIKLTCRREVLPLMLHLAARYHRRIKPIDRGTTDDWSYSAPRRGNAAPNSWSDHSSGTAIDLNAVHHGQQGPSQLGWWGKIGKRTKGLARGVFAAALARRHLCIWGGPTTYGGSYEHPQNWDFMHFALRPGTTIADVQKWLRKKKIGPDGRKIKKR